ncbi:hypothetical protein BM526_14200 [Alteromonas mediterranea]|uniref:hypothetical protein n=1 Tax=Alteromonas mediterranea TaxID=314275 RepID=UPI000904041D|nr:hypothetical protein [Alteromonas mediterranea]APE02904.1 hypothetical protein BM526_14200 [Alteromonas mediterranea]
MGLFTSFKKSRLENKFKKKEWVIIQPIPFAQFEQLIIDHVDSGWEIEDDYERLTETTAKWQCELRKGTSILTCIWTANHQGIVYGPERVLTGLSEKLKVSTSKTITTPWF